MYKLPWFRIGSVLGTTTLVQNSYYSMDKLPWFRIGSVLGTNYFGSE